MSWLEARVGLLRLRELPLNMASLCSDMDADASLLLYVCLRLILLVRLASSGFISGGYSAIFLKVENRNTSMGMLNKCKAPATVAIRKADSSTLPS